MYAKFAARTPGIGNTAGGLLAAAAHWLCRGLRIATGARPPRLTRGAAGVSLWGLPQVVARQPAGAAWGTGQIARCEVAFARPGAPSRVARWGRNVPAVLGMKLSR